jgi:hypothetical protein
MAAAAEKETASTAEAATASTAEAAAVGRRRHPQGNIGTIMKARSGGKDFNAGRALCHCQ